MIKLFERKCLVEALLQIAEEIEKKEANGT